MTAYVLIDREHRQDVAVQYRDLTDAVHALDHDLLIDSICEEDCVDAYVSEDPADLEGREVIDPDDIEWLTIGSDEPEPEVYVISERVLTDDTLAIAPEGATFRGGYVAVLTYHTFGGPWHDEVHVRRFRSMDTAERFIVKRYGRTWTDLVYGSDDETTD